MLQYDSALSLVILKHWRVERRGRTDVCCVSGGRGKEPVQSVMDTSLLVWGVLALEVHAALILTEGPDSRAHVVNFSSFVFA